MRFLFSTLISSIALSLAVQADPAPAMTFMDCLLWQESPPASVSEPHEDNHARSLYLVGTASLRNDTGKTLGLKQGIIHVDDGYGHPLFDLNLEPISLASHETVKIPLVHWFGGGIGVFRFRGEFVLSTSQGTQKLKLEPTGQGPIPPEGRMPGY
ncbi:hypothetical protein JST97_32535 [bacterium]|nr:hypothetical protein [bacterium]